MLVYNLDFLTPQPFLQDQIFLMWSLKMVNFSLICSWGFVSGFWGTIDGNGKFGETMCLGPKISEDHRGMSSLTIGKRKSQIKPKADCSAIDSPKKRTNLFLLPWQFGSTWNLKFRFQVQTFLYCKAKKNQNWFVRSDSTAC